MHRDSWAAIGATVIVLGAVTLGLRSLGGPGNQRAVQSDLRVLQTLQSLAQSILVVSNNTHGQLPADLSALPVNLRNNPATGQSFIYRPHAATAYELCTTFTTASPASSPQKISDLWAHPKGNYCFHLDASQPIPQVPFSY